MKLSEEIIMSRWTEDEIRLSHLKMMRNNFYMQRAYPRPKTSPYDEEIKELEMKMRSE